MQSRNRDKKTRTNKSCAAHSFRSGGPDTDLRTATPWCGRSVLCSVLPSAAIGNAKTTILIDQNMHARVSPMWRARAEAGARGLAA